MYKIFVILLTFIFAQGCSSQSSSYLSSGITLASGGASAKNLFVTGSNFYIENKTGKSTLQHVSDKPLDYEIRESQITHSAEINKILFHHLDQIDRQI